jgi:hypothetical protein
MHIARGLLLVGALVIAWTLSVLTPGQAEDFGPVDGIWEGSLGTINGAGLSTSDKPLPIRMTIRDKRAQVFTGENFNVEVKPERFRVDRIATNLVVFAIDSGEDTDGVWVETWAFAMTQKTPNTLMTNLIRVVNNTNLPLSVDYSKFSVAKTGELKRVSPE